MTEFYYEISASIISCIIGIFAFLIKHWKTYNDEVNKEKYELLKFRLEKFYFPIYIKLRQDKYLWNFVQTLPTESINWEEIDAINIKNHTEVMKIFHELVSEANPCSDILKEFLKYDKHASTYELLRKFNIKDKYPRDVNSPYPYMLLDMVYHRIVEIRSELNYTNAEFKDFDEEKDEINIESRCFM